MKHYSLFVSNWRNASGKPAMPTIPEIDEGDIITTKEQALQAIIFLLSKWKIQPQEVLEEYNKLVH